MNKQIAVLSIATQAGIPAVLWGEPGIGKSAQIEQMAAKLNRHLETVIASLREPADFNGLPLIDAGKTHMAAPSWAEKLAQISNGILFLDEISTAPPAVQAALLRVVLDRVAGDIQLPENTSIIAAANSAECAAGGWELSPPMANRFLHLEWAVDRDSWHSWMSGGNTFSNISILPDDWKNGIQAAKSLISSFIKTRPSLLHAMPADDDQRGQAWPSPRTWDMSAKALAAAESIQADEDIMMYLLSGLVGQAPALEFLAWKRELDLPNPEDLLRNPESLKLTPRSDRNFAILNAVTSAVLSNNTAARWTAGFKVLAEAVKQEAADLAAATARTLAQNKPNGATIPVNELKALTPILKQAGLQK